MNNDNEFAYHVLLFVTIMATIPNAILLVYFIRETWKSMREAKEKK